MINDVIICGIIGMVLQMLMKAKSIQDKARLGNIQFKFMEYFVNDWLSHLISTFALTLFIYMAKGRIASIPLKDKTALYEWILALSATVGYSATDIVSRFFSLTNKKINAALDYKTTMADKANGTENAPTPK